MNHYSFEKFLIIPPFQGLPPEEIDATKDDLIGEGGRIRDGLVKKIYDILNKIIFRYIHGSLIH